MPYESFYKTNLYLANTSQNYWDILKKNALQSVQKTIFKYKEWWWQQK